MSIALFQFSCIFIIFRQISQISLTTWEMIGLLILGVISYAFLSYAFYLVLVLLLYLSGLRHGLKKKQALACFYSLYTITILTLLGNFLTVIAKSDFMLLALIPITIIVNSLVLKVFHLNLDFLRNNYWQISKTFLTLLNIGLFILCSLQFWSYYYDLAEVRIYLTVGLISLIISLITYLGLKVRLLQEKQLQQNQQSQLEQLIQYTNQIESLYNEVRGIRHDYTNMVASLGHSIDQSDLEAIKTIYEQVLRQASQQLQSPKYDLINLANIESAALKGLISAKIIAAQSKNISLQVEVTPNFTPVGINLLDLVRILSILLDNAIEAAEATPTPQINIALIAENTKQVLVIQNTCATSPLKQQKLFKRGFSTKGENRGLGLAIIQELMLKYDNLSLNTQYTAPFFTQELIITKEVD